MKNLNNITRKELILSLIIVYGFASLVTFVSTLTNMLDYVGGRWWIAALKALSSIGVFVVSAIVSMEAVALLVRDDGTEDDRTFLMQFEASKTSKEERDKICDYVRHRLPIGSMLIVLPNDISLTEINPEDRRRLEDVKNLLLQDAEKLRKLGEQKVKTGY